MCLGILAGHKDEARNIVGPYEQNISSESDNKCISKYEASQVYHESFREAFRSRLTRVIVYCPLACRLAGQR